MKKDSNKPVAAPGKKSKLSDVSTLAGVSVATVSRVINSPGAVRKVLRDKVELAMAELNYIPDAAARALSSRRMNTIGAIMPTLSTAIFSEWVVALQNRLDAAGFSLLISSSEYSPDTEFKALTSFLNRGVDGVILTGSNHLPASYALLQQHNIPALCSFTHDCGGELPCVGFDHRQAMRELADYLVRIGHREIGVITSPLTHNDRLQARIVGIRDALASVGAALPPERLIEVPYSVEEGRNAFNHLMASHPGITAVMCTTDMLAVGALLEANRLGYEVPQHVSITGFDDLELIRHMLPPLTSVKSPSRLIGEQCADAIVGLVTGKPAVIADIFTQPVIRASSAKPRAKAGKR
ncbi:LacI family DNA-binding transcriptional regulator [Herbaspirillum sp. WKF16]|uniref:LacI family DNA-binding transcriptional regulator n=1 Tax=Herbaspirillum sp. WKF16 TaxID=3028312 RepID=UPI0023A938B7|nr:LacI family DNA-binding transcriptional regulator [Herbaspirillum sp. WKF16]WDZ95960.1 LacI family DNA-binding transcriptional regulator [Herbaspirillum sp. WKF16]